MSAVIRINDGVYFEYDFGVLTSHGLKEPCPYCGQDDCYADCDGSQGDIDGLESEEEMIERRVTNARVDGLEALILAMAKDHNLLESKTKEAIITAVDAIANHS
jgi:hypothetical protein